MNKSRFSLVVVLMLTVVWLGCNKRPKLPQTHPVQGKVVFRGQPITQGVITFHSLDNPHVTATGEVQKDGSFTLHSFVSGSRAAGAIAGRHRAMVTPPLGANQEATAGYPPTTIEPVLIQAGENQVTLALDKTGS